jgi:ribosomal protein S12 methylthiotransferase
MPCNEELPLTGERLLTTPEYWSYLKIADGCSNRCTYCAIPSIRGNYRSVEFETLVEEAKQLAAAGTKELVLIAQDTTNYGADLYGKIRLPELLDALCEIDGIEWIRMLYCYPDKITDELIETMARQPKVLHYIDLPLQHANDRILKAMNRRGTSEDIRKTIEKLRKEIPDVVIRTTFIVGFPGEDDEAFEDLATFVNEIEFDRLGCFSFSPQEGTPAYDMDDQLEDDVKLNRGDIIMQDQLAIMEEKNNAKIGNTYKTIVEEYDSYTDSYIGRTYMDAPEIDSVVKFTSAKNLEIGDFADVRIFDFDEYDLLGEVR